MSTNQGQVRFARIRGRIVPIRSKGTQAKKQAAKSTTKIISDRELSRGFVAREGFISGLGSGGASVLGGGTGYTLSNHLNPKIESLSQKGGMVGRILKKGGTLGAAKFGSKVALVGLGYGTFYAAYAALSPRKGEMRTVQTTPGSRTGAI